MVISLIYLQISAIDCRYLYLIEDICKCGLNVKTACHTAQLQVLQSAGEMKCSYVIIIVMVNGLHDVTCTAVFPSTCRQQNAEEKTVGSGH